MAKFAFYDIKCTKFDTETDGKKETVIIDAVNIQITKRVNTATMQGEKGEDYRVPIADLPYLFGSDVKFPAFEGYDAAKRIEAVKKFLAVYVGKNCAAEEITRGKNKVLTYLEFDN